MGWSTELLLALDPFCPVDQPFEEPPALPDVEGQPPRPGGVRPDFPQRS